MRHACIECSREESVKLTGPGQTIAECDHCMSAWSVQWVGIPVNGCRKLVAPKLTLINDRTDHWSSIGDIAIGAVSSIAPSLSDQEAA